MESKGSFINILEEFLKTYASSSSIMRFGANDKTFSRGNVTARVYWVRAGANGDGRSAENPAGNITYLLENYDLSNSVINVLPGEYNESIEKFPLILEYTNLTIRAIGDASETVIKFPIKEVFIPGLHAAIIVKAANITIEGLKISGSYTGIRVIGNAHGTVIRGNIFENTTCAVALDTSYNLVKDNVFYRNYIGVFIGVSWRGSNNIVSNNVFRKTDIDVVVYTAENIIRGNRMSSGILIDTSLEAAVSQVIENNTINGKPILYYKNQREISVSAEIGQLILVNTTGFRINGLSISNACIGIEVLYSQEIVIESNCLENNIYGIGVANSEKITISNNKLINNTVGVFFSYVNASIVRDNKFLDNYYGVLLITSSNNLVTKNLFSENKFGILLMGGPLILWSPSPPPSINNKILDNQFSGNKVGIAFNKTMGSLATSNFVYRNNFVANNIHAIDNCGKNYFNDSSSGNFWDDYNGSDLDGDGIGDTPYRIPGEGKSFDYKPLMKPLKIFDEQKGETISLVSVKLIVGVTIFVCIAIILVYYKKRIMH